MNRLVRKVASVSIAIATVVSLSGAAPAFAQTSAADLQAQITQLLALIQTLQAQLTAQGASPVASSYTFTRSLTVGSVGADVKALQQWLNASGYTVSVSGAGSVGSETTTFGPKTKAALAKYQAAKGISPAVGYFGPITRAAVAAAAPVTPVTPGTTPPIVVVPAGTDLQVSLAADTPSARTIGSGTAFNPALKVALTAGSKAVKVTSITLQKTGFVANTNLNGVDIVDSKSVRHGQVVTSVNADNTITILMTSDPVTVAAGSTEYLLVRFNLLTGSITGTVAFGINAVSAIVADTTAIAGAFPINGNAMNIVSGATSLASTTLEILTSTGSSTLNVDPASAQEITKFRITENSSNEGVYLDNFTLYNYGNAADTDYKDVQLVATDGTVLATAQPKGQYTTFTLATPYLIDKGIQKDLTVKAKLVGGSTKTLKLVVYNNYDINLRGATTGVSVIPSPGTNDTSFPLGNAYNQTTIGSGTITLTRALDSPSSAVVPGATSVVLAKFNAKPNGENYELRQVSFYITTSTLGTLTGTVYVKVNGVIAYSAGASTFSTGAVVTVALSSYPTLTAGVDNPIIIEVSAIPSTATSASSYTVTGFNIEQVKRLITNDILSNGDTGLTTSDVNGLTIAAKAAAMSVTTLSTPGVSSVVAGTNGYEYATFQLNAQSGGEDVKVSSIVVDHVEAANLTEVANLYIYKDAETSPLVTTASTATNATTVTFTFSSSILVTRAAPVTLHLKADAVSGTNPHTFTITSSTSAVSATGASTGNGLTSGSDITYAGGGQAQTHVAAGALSVSLVSGSGASPASNQVVSAGTSGVTLFAFKMSSQYETQKITSLKISATSSGSTALATSTIRNIKLYADNASLPFAQASQFDDCTSGTCTVTYTATDNLLAAAVPLTGVTIYVKGDIGAGGVADLGNSYKFFIASSTGDIAVKGSVTASTSGTRTGTPAASGYTFVVPQSVVVRAVSPTVATTIGTGSGQTVGIFEIKNNGTSAILLSTSTLTFTNGGSASTTLAAETSLFRIYASAVGGSQSDTSGWGGGASSGAGYLGKFGTTGTSSSVIFATTTISAAEQTIDGGSWRFFTIKTAQPVDNNNYFQFSVSALGNIKFNVAESSLGYSGNPSADSNLTDTIYGLYADGLPALQTVTSKT
ncbi:MAG: peptidoglycan-binding domain-containing protein [Candidatus Jorgensenbacteria bacterium]